MSRAFESERTMLERAVSQTEPGRTAVHQIVDAYLDFHLAHPHNRSLWAHRWVDDAADISELEDRYARPLLTLAAHKIRDVVPSDVDPYYLLGTMVWCVHGFLGSGVLERTQGMRRADNPEAVASFRHHLHVLMDKLLAPAPRPLADRRGGWWPRPTPARRWDRRAGVRQRPRAMGRESGPMVKKDGE